jgi:hypothetical protein
MPIGRWIDDSTDFSATVDWFDSLKTATHTTSSSTALWPASASIREHDPRPPKSTNGPHARDFGPYRPPQPTGRMDIVNTF